MNPHKLTVCLVVFLLSSTLTYAQKRRVPPGGRVAVVVDERLAALRESPRFDGKLMHRLSRGRLIAVKATKRNADGLFVLVNLTSRTHGWLLRDAIVFPNDGNDEERLWQLIKSSSEFDLIVRARLFLDYFPRSKKRSEVLLLLGDTAEAIAATLTRDASRRIVTVGPEVERNYYLNYSGLDRYNRLGVTFKFDSQSKRLRYNGAAWREIVRRFPGSAASVQAKLRLESR